MSGRPKISMGPQAPADLHVPDPRDLARESLGEAAEGWIAEGRSMTLDTAIALARQVVAQDPVGPGGGI